MMTGLLIIYVQCQDLRAVGPGLDPDCLHVNSLNISEEMPDAPQEFLLLFSLH